MILNINNKQLNTITGELIHNGQITQLEPKVLAVFNALYLAKGAMLTQNELLEDVWKDTIVAPNALQRCITLLRKLLDDNDRTLIQTFPKKGYRLAYKQISTVALQKRSILSKYAFTLSLFFAIMVMGGVFIFTGDHKAIVLLKTPTLSQVIPITHSNLPEYNGHYKNNFIAYITNNTKGNEQTLTLLDRKNNQTKKLLNSTAFDSAPHFNPSGEALIIAKQVKHSSTVKPKKCSQLLLITLAQDKSTNIGKCTYPLIKQVQWLDEQHVMVLFEHTLYALNIHTQSRTPLHGLPKSIKHIATINSYTSAEGKKYILLSGIDHQHNNYFWYLEYKHHQVHSLYQTPLQYNVFAASKLFVYKDTVIQTYNNVLYGYDHTRLGFKLAFHDHQQLQLNDVIDSQALLATLSFKDTEVTQRQFNNPSQFVDNTLIDSAFQDSHAQFQPNGQAVAFLSTRSGTSQLWLKRNATIKQLTFAKPIQNFVWQQNGQGLWFVSDHQLFTVNLNGDLQAMTIQFPISRLFQHYGSNMKGTLLAQSKEGSRLININLQNKHVSVFYSKAVSWAQRTSQGNIYVAIGDSPFLQQLHNGELITVKGFENVRLQWRFYYRNNRLIVPDKQQAIWAFDPSNHSKERVGHYGITTYLATDIKLAPTRLLGTSPNEHRANLVELTLQ